MDFSEYKLSVELRIDWSDLDTYKHVNNVMFMKYQQSGRVNFWEASGLYELHLKTNRNSYPWLCITFGSLISTVVPLFSSLCETLILPIWYFSMIRLESESPSPQPLFLVV